MRGTNEQRTISSRDWNSESARGRRESGGAIDAVFSLAPPSRNNSARWRSANLAKPRPKPPFDLTGTWMHGGGPNNGFRFTPPPGIKLTPRRRLNSTSPSRRVRRARFTATISANAGPPDCP